MSISLQLEYTSIRLVMLCTTCSGTLLVVFLYFNTTIAVLKNISLSNSYVESDIC